MARELRFHRRVALQLDFLFDPEPTEELKQQLLDVWVEVTNADGAVGFVPPVERADIAPALERALAAIERGDDHLIVGVNEGEVVGFAFLVGRPSPLFRHWITVKRLQVLPELQGQGLGSQFMDAIERFSRELGLEQIHLTVRGETGTELFYERHGYEIVATLPGVIRVSPGNDVDEIYMIKRL